MRLLPRSLFGRMALVLFAGLLFAQLLSSAINFAERDRLLLTLRYLDGLDYRTIGATLGVNPESVGQFLHRAKSRLARLVPHLQRWVEETAEQESP